MRVIISQCRILPQKTSAMCMPGVITQKFRPPQGQMGAVMPLWMHTLSKKRGLKTVKRNVSMRFHAAVLWPVD